MLRCEIGRRRLLLAVQRRDHHAVQQLLLRVSPGLARGRLDDQDVVRTLRTPRGIVRYSINRRLWFVEQCLIFAY